MSLTDKSFFNENIVNVNKKVNIILFCTIPVPIIFAVLSAVGLWIVPPMYSLSVFFIFNNFIFFISFFDEKEF